MASIPHIQYGVVSGSGVTLSLPHSAGLQSSLPLLQKNYKFTKVFFWGKLTGLTGDYLIAMGIEESYTTKKFFFCQDGVSWAQLPLVTDEMVADCGKLPAGKPLSGDASKIDALPAEPVPEGEDPPEDPVLKEVKEVERVAVMVCTIDTECAMLPAGALTKMPDGTVVDSPTYAGLDYAKASVVSSFVLTSKPKASDVLADALTAATDFLTCADTVQPKGSLVPKFDESINVVTWRSLLYPGFFAYTTVGFPMHGYCYFGSGEKNSDIAFMLP